MLRGLWDLEAEAPPLSLLNQKRSLWKPQAQGEPQCSAAASHQDSQATQLRSGLARPFGQKPACPEGLLPRQSSEIVPRVTHFFHEPYLPRGSREQL